MDVKQCDNDKCKKIYRANRDGSFSLRRMDDPMITHPGMFPEEMDLCSLGCVKAVAEDYLLVHPRFGSDG